MTNSGQRKRTGKRSPSKQRATLAQTTPPGPFRRLVSKPATWIAAGIATAATTILVAALTSIPSQIVDERKLGDSIRGGDDLSVTVEQVTDDGFYSMAFPGRWDLPANDSLGSHVDVESALSLVQTGRNAGAYPVPYLRVRLVLEGRRNQQIQITNLIITDLQFERPIRGTLVGLSHEGGTKNEHLLFSLDDPIPRALTAGDDAQSAEKSYFAEKSISLADREQVVLLIQFNARRDTSAKFNLALQYLIGGETRQLRIDNNGEPFRVTSPSCSGRGAVSVDYDHAYEMVVTDHGYGLQLASDPHHVTSPGLNCY